MNTTVTQRPPAHARTIEPSFDRSSRREFAIKLGRFTAIALQLILALAVVRLYQLENRTFYNIMLLAVAAFAVHAMLPRRYRLPFFTAASIAAVLVAFGWADGARLLATGIVLIGVCHLPVRWGFRVVALLVIGAALAVGRANVVPFGWGAMVWPILGAMFMFRLALYMQAVRQAEFRFDPWRTLAYFFMLPNVVFPLYPVVDYTSFEKNHYDRDALEIYEIGVSWIARGLLQLVLYRLVYRYVLTAAADVVDLTGLLQFLLGTFLLYLRVSGSFHLIVGVLHLFGFRLPETHKLYYLSSGFTDFWRRINIYWKDFMMKLVYYPSFFRLRHWGTERAVIAATISVFIATWLLHSYQWFWLRGGFPLTAQDFLFWGLLGGLVVRASLREMRAPRQRRLGRSETWSAKRAVNTVGTFIFICILWSLWSSESTMEWIWMWRAGLNVTPDGVVLLLGLVVLGLIISGWHWTTAGSAENSAGFRLVFHPSVRAAATLLLLVGVAQTDEYEAGAPQVASIVGSLKAPTLNKEDAELQHRGYYEKLDNPGRMSGKLWSDLPEKPADWVGAWQVGLVRDREDFLGWALVPSVSVNWNGATFTTNRWGMRDRDYTREKPPGTFRIAVVGQSHVMGSKVADQEVFDVMMEESLNREDRPIRYEVLNFATAAYSMAQQLALIDSKVLDFSPDVVVITVANNNRAATVRHLLHVAFSREPIPYPPLRSLLEAHGLAGLRSEGVPIPFRPLRELAADRGLTVRTPHGEVMARARLAASEVNIWAMQEAVRMISEAGALPVVLALATVGDEPDEAFPELDAALQAGYTVFDLFDVYSGHPEADLRVAPWDDHPNATGHRLIANRLIEEFQGMGLLDGADRVSAVPQQR